MDSVKDRFPLVLDANSTKSIQRFRSEAIYDKFVVAGFKKRIEPGQTSEGYPLQLGNYTDLRWAYGEVNTTTGNLEFYSSSGVSGITLPAFAFSGLLYAYYQVI